MFTVHKQTTTQASGNGQKWQQLENDIRLVDEKTPHQMISLHICQMNFKTSNNCWARMVLWQIKRRQIIIQQQKIMYRIWIYQMVIVLQQIKAANSIQCKNIHCTQPHQIQWRTICQQTVPKWVTVRRPYRHRHHHHHPHHSNINTID